MAASFMNRLNRQLLSRPGAIQFAQVGQRLGDLPGQFLRLRATKIDDLLGDAKLEQLSGQLDELVAILTIPTKLERPPDLGRIPADSTTRLLEHRGQLPDLVRVAAGDVP